MRRDGFAEWAARCLEEIAAPLEEEDRRAGRGMTAVRANELRVAAHVVRDLSAAVSREEERGSSVRRLPLEVPSSDPWRAAPRRAGTRSGTTGSEGVPVMITEKTTIDYDIHGEGPPLILIGGLGFGRWAFFKQIPALSRHFHTITFDARGERDLEDGVSDLAADVVALMEHLNVRKAHILGTSLGGFVAQELAIKRPDLVDGLVLVCTSYGRGGPETLSPWALSDMIGLPSLSVERAVCRGLETAAFEAYRAEHPEEFEKIVRWRLADSSSLSAYYEQMRAGARFDASRQVGS